MGDQDRLDVRRQQAEITATLLQVRIHVLCGAGHGKVASLIMFSQNCGIFACILCFSARIFFS
jgi:hypothetical protein